MNRLIRTMEEGLEKIGKKSEVLVETTKLKLQISQLQKEVAEKQQELGALYYTLYKQESEEKEPLENICLEILELEKKIFGLEKEMGKKDSGSLICPKCKTVNAKNAKFCSSCGERIEGFICQKCGEALEAGEFCASCEANKEETIPKVPDKIPAGAAGPTCPNCGTELEPEAKSCDGCGGIIENGLVPEGVPEPETTLSQQSVEDPVVAEPEAEPEAEPPQSAPEKICSICGTKVEPGIQFCTRCGGSIP